MKKTSTVGQYRSWFLSCFKLTTRWLPSHLFLSVDRTKQKEMKVFWFRISR